jgi:hypothetical protein
LCREAAHSVATRPVEGILPRTYIVRSSFGRVKYLVQRKNADEKTEFSSISALTGHPSSVGDERPHQIPDPFRPRPVEGILPRTYIVRSSFGRVKYLVQRKKEYLLTPKLHRAIQKGRNRRNCR